MVPQETPLLGTRPTYREVDGHDYSATHAHPPAEDHDDTVEAHYASLERPHACIDGWVFLGRIVESEHDLDGEVVESERVPCRRCADSR
jgi:predicted GNAT family N-acyltransferase